MEQDQGLQEAHVAAAESVFQEITRSLFSACTSDLKGGLIENQRGLFSCLALLPLAFLHSKTNKMRPRPKVLHKNEAELIKRRLVTQSTERMQP